MNRLSEDDLFLIGEHYSEDNAIILAYNFYKHLLENANKDRDDVYAKNLKYLFKTYDNIVENINNKMYELKNIIILYAIFLIENEYIEIRFDAKCK